MLTRLRGWFNDRFIAPEVEARVTECLKASASPVAASLDPTQAGWTKLSADRSRDLDPTTRDRMVQIVEFLYTTNPLGKRIIEWTKEFVCAEGFNTHSSDEDTNTFLDAWWSDPVNNLDLNIKRHTKNLGLYGELCLPVFVSQYTGFVRYGHISAQQIDSVVTDPANSIMPVGVILKAGLDGKNPKLRIVIPGNEAELLSPRAVELRKGFTDGDCHYFAVNQVDSMARGISDLFPVADTIDGYDQSMYAHLDRIQILSRYNLGVTLEGYSQAQIDDWLSKQKMPGTGTMLAHNEKTRYEFLTPDLKGADTSDAMRMQRNHALGGANIPEHWFGGGGDVNRSTSESMDTPTFKGMKDRQDYVISMIRVMAGYAIEQRISHGMLSDTPETRDFTVSAPEMVTRDQTKIATALHQLTASLSMAMQMGLIDSRNASRVFVSAVAQAGTEVDPDDAYKAAQEEAEANGYEDYKNDPKTGAAKTAQNAPQGGGEA